ncbi:phosphatidylserine decarboxylase family protein [Taibaiella koreensis]|uniref:phosphatidylserine decarboxylase family protein n=1 Tax=Taibaiella koreensis TaxID=1268548 RepID=UPI000E59A77F|nr:phosphatidylserine decarboxylase family protein [Taibaiella koreensis]
MYIHREGYIHILIATILWIGISWLNFHFLYSIPVLYWPIQIVFFLLWFWVLWFFRIPVRKFTEGENVVVAPADGKVVVIEETQEGEYFKDKRLQVSIFMSPLNVHVNRSPITGKVDYVKYHPGKYLVAWHPKSSTENERTTVVVSNNHVTLLMRQIAGAMARRIKYYVKGGETIQQNAEFGFIRFGSRVDVFFPVGTKIEVKIGEAVKGGQTILAKI